MILRPYQSFLVEQAKTALDRHGNTLVVAATGAGKTICLSALADEVGGKQLVLQHRQELIKQNAAKFRQIAPQKRVSFVTADNKSWRGDSVFAMVQTLAKPENLKRMPKLDLIVVDEAHHVAAKSWQKILEVAKDKNPNCKIAGFTATPERSDKKGLRSVFTNICSVISTQYLIALGFLVPFRTFVVDIDGVSSRLTKLNIVNDWGDQAKVAEVLNTQKINVEVVRNWKEQAGGRQTIVFCSTVKHAQDVAATFCNEGIMAECIHGAMSDDEREAVIKRLDRGKTQVVTNVQVLTEGFDSQPVSCVILLRKCSAKSTLIQMVGRGLRKLDPSLFPNVEKNDCLVLDFGTSLLTHGDLNSGTSLGELKPEDDLQKKHKICPRSQAATEYYAVPDRNGLFGCGGEVPHGLKICPFCGFEFERLAGSNPEEDEAPDRVVLTEIDLLSRSPFQYVNLFESGKALLGNGFEAWAGVFTKDNQNWIAIGGTKDRKASKLITGSKTLAIASADDFLRTHETQKGVTKKTGWLTDYATDKQLNLLGRFGYAGSTFDWTKYEAACHLTFNFNRQQIERLIA